MTLVCRRAVNSPSPSQGEESDRQPGVGASGMGWCRRRRQGRCRCSSTRASGVQPSPPPAPSPSPSPPATPPALAHLPLSNEGGQLLGPLVHQADMLDGVDQGLCIIWVGAEGKTWESEPQGHTFLKGLQNLLSIGATQLSHSQTRRCPCPPHARGPPLRLTLVVVGDVVRGLRVDEQGWQAQRLVGLVS